MGPTLRSLAAVCLLAAAAPAWAQTTQGSMVARDAWMHAPPVLGGDGAAHFRLANRGDRVERLVAASSPAAHRVEIHTHVVEGGHLRMQRLRSVEVHPGASMTFRPGGLHIMLIDMKVPLDKNRPVRVRLRFERAGEMVLDVPIVPARRYGPPPPKAPPKDPVIPRVKSHRR